MKFNLKILGKMNVDKFSKKVVEIKKPQPKCEIIHFDLDKSKKRVIGRLSNGKIAIISYDYKGPWVHAGDDWSCEINEMDNKAIVIPVQLITSSTENDELIKSGIKNLQEKDWNKTTTYKKRHASTR